jgi:hypothetical protein
LRTDTDMRRYLSDGTQPFDSTSSSSQYLQHDDGNIRYHPSYYDTNGMDPSKSSAISRLSRSVNSTRLAEHPVQQLSTDLVLERGVYRDRAAAKIQAAYRGYSVRKSLPWLNDKHEHSSSESNRRVHTRFDSSKPNLVVPFFSRLISMEKAHPSTSIFA